jgi:hypothetical protein
LRVFYDFSFSEESLKVLVETQFYFLTNCNPLSIILNFLPDLKITEALRTFFGETASGVALPVPFTLI